MRIFVTGSRGQLGTELMALLEPSRHEVLGVDLDTCDMTDRDQVLGAITSYEPDLILHGAAMTAVDLCETEPAQAFLANSVASRFVADGARRIGAHVVYVSTDYVFDGSKTSPYVEWDLPNPRSVYGLSKLGGEREMDPGWTVCRTSWVCGYHGNNMVKTVLRAAREHDTLTFVDDQIGHPTFAADLARMIAKLGTERVPGIHHVTNQGAVSWYGFVREIMKASGQDPERVHPIPTSELQPPRPAARPANSVLDNFALRATGIELLADFREPLAKVVSRLQADGM